MGCWQTCALSPICATSSRKSKSPWSGMQQLQTRHPVWGDGYQAAMINYRFFAHALLSTDELVEPDATEGGRRPVKQPSRPIR